MQIHAVTLILYAYIHMRTYIRVCVYDFHNTYLIFTAKLLTIPIVLPAVGGGNPEFCLQWCRF